MSSTTTPPAAAPRRRNPVLVTLDIVVAVAIIAFALVFGLVILGLVTQFGGFTANCGVGPYTGLQCNATVLGIATYGLLVVTVLAFVLGVGMAIVRIIQKRLVFVWPLGALIVMYLAFNIAAWVAGQTVPA